MADEADIANTFIDNEVSRALDKMRRNMEAKPGSRVCKECEEDIPLERCKLGFQLCVHCAEESERRGSLFATY